MLCAVSRWSSKSPMPKFICWRLQWPLPLGVYLHITLMEWMAVTFAIASVIGAEALNTSVEKVVDLASPEWHETAGQAKDAAAAAVLIFSIGAAVVGGLIFVPKLLAL